jgi:hypothetical protein
MHALEEAREVHEVRLHAGGLAHHVRVQELRDGAAGGMACDEQAAGAAAGAVGEEFAQAGGDFGDRLARDVEEAGVAVVAGVVEEVCGWGGRGVVVYGPVHEGGGSADGEDDGLHGVEGKRG